MSKLKIEVDKFYKTRNGCKVKIYSIYPEKSKYPIHGAIECKDGDWTVCSWTTLGSMDILRSESTGDLVAEWSDSKPRRLAYVSTLGVLFLLFDEQIKDFLPGSLSRVPHLDEPETQNE